MLVPPEETKKRGKFQKKYSKPCQVCNGKVELYQYEEEIGNVIYYHHFLECVDCENRVELKRDHHKRNDNTKYDW